MRLCPVCTSDELERTSSTGLRVIVCIVLILIPLGIFICWIPFVFPHKFQCKVCGFDGAQDTFREMDWREFEAYKQKYAALLEQFRPTLGKWFQDQEERLYKAVEFRGHLMLIRFGQEDMDSYILLGYTPEENRITVIKAGDYMRASDYNGNNLTPLGQQMVEAEEYEMFRRQEETSMVQWLAEQGKMTAPQQVEIRTIDEKTTSGATEATA